MSEMSRASRIEELDRVFVEMARYFLSQWLEEEEQISPKQFILLRVLHQRGRSTVSELASILKQSNSATTIALNRLVKAGYVDRIRDEQDRRVVWVALSDTAMPLMEKLLARRRVLLGKLLENLSDEEIKQFTHFLVKMKQCL
ncbi:MarR family winged helix-turn-helix transcriptional regulator [Brevibacillus centrosporus]|uniref:DNA-binding transcriptional regulator, MarR family n=1 Tax=Brevibacillus centrosporus TaxID=54910 RepID=A0A1I3NDL4_9BACL|nr:MarR family transcriptional regulator [Brevibacillus centrosporus]MEC2128344.1 MarR family transcriptional regulator [Brevibacillus centrosporus]MED4909768.1 MarR family transcriptional regulator [Brevibacillus centrosporus]RNB73805.1 MarR family transcriptional regulator [Brevibacillus centrosporus]SFJ07272.1 DNA-binding transcriptional regulator, MarR family [Brevibacillus centrosporus]